MPSVAAAAEEARVSRATAYRYFPTPEALHVEVAGVTPAYAPVEQLLSTFGESNTEDRLVSLINEFNGITFAEEARMRIALRVYLDTWLAGQRSGKLIPRVREGRRMRWLDRVLEPLGSSGTVEQRQRLKAALALTIGADALVVMKDVCGLEDEEAQEVLRWAARALLRASLEEVAAPPNG